ncbi:MAG: hypothetical protein IJL34_08535, partial [Treponema sp.]|nr:hypothetical protein [Treponema sp.]
MNLSIVLNRNPLHAESTHREKYDYGAVLSFKHSDFRIFGADGEKDFRASGRIFVKPCGYELTLSLGSLTTSGSLSRLKNPAISTNFSPLSKSFSLDTGLSVAQTGLSSGKKPGSAAITFKTPRLIEFLSVAESVADNNKNFASGISLSYKTGTYSAFSVALTAASTVLEGSSTLLKKNHAAFDKDRYTSACLETTFRCPLVKTALTLTMHKNPFDNIGLSLRAKARLTRGRFLGDLSYFCVPTAKNAPRVTPIVCADSSLCKTTEQVGMGAQLAFFPMLDRSSGGKKIPAELRFGLNSLASHKYAGTSKIEFLDVLKVTGGAILKTQKSSVKLTGTAANLILEGKAPNKSSAPQKYYDSNLSLTHNTTELYSSFTADYKNYPKTMYSSCKKEELSVS